MIENGEKKIDILKDKDVVLLIGSTGVGKSTLINILQGNILEEKEV